MSGTNGVGPVMVSANCDSAANLCSGYSSQGQHEQHVYGPSDDSTFTPCDPKHGLSALQQFANGAAAASAAVAAAAAVEPVTPGSTAWQAATELIRLQGQEPTIPLVTLVAARLLAQQRQLQQQQEALQCADAAAAASPARGNFTRFCKRGGTFIAKPARSAAAAAAAAGPSRGSFDCTASGRSGPAVQLQGGKQKGRTTCQVDGCLIDLPLGKDTYNGRYRVCAKHMVDPAVVLYADTPQQLYRFCNQCFKFEPLAAFDGSKRGCRASLAKRRERQRAKKLGVLQPKTQPRKKRQQQQQHEEDAEEDLHQHCEQYNHEQYNCEQEQDCAMELQQQQQHYMQQQICPGVDHASAAAAAAAAAPELGPMQALLLSQISLPAGTMWADLQTEMGRDLMDMPSQGEAEFMKTLLEELGADTAPQDQLAAAAAPAAPGAAMPGSSGALGAMQQELSNAQLHGQPQAYPQQQQQQQQQQQCWAAGSSMGQPVWQPAAAAARPSSLQQQQHASLSPLQLQQPSVLPMQAVQNGAATVNPRFPEQLRHMDTDSVAPGAAVRITAAVSSPSVFNKPDSSSSDSEGGSSSSDSKSDAAGRNKARAGVAGYSRSSECDSCSSAAASAAQQRRKRIAASQQPQQPQQQQQQQQQCVRGGRDRSSFEGSPATVMQDEGILAATAAAAVASPPHTRHHKKRLLQEDAAAVIAAAVAADMEMTDAQPASTAPAPAAAAQPPSLAAAWQQLLKRQASAAAAAAAGFARAGSPDPAPLRAPTEDFLGLEELLNQHQRASSAPPASAQNLAQDPNIGQIDRPGSEPWTSERLGSTGVPAGFLGNAGEQAAGQLPNPVLLATAVFGSGVYDAMLDELSAWYTNANASDQQAAAAAMAAAVAAPQQQQQQLLAHPTQLAAVHSLRASCDAATIDASVTAANMQLQQQQQLEQWQQQQQDDLLLPPCTNTPPVDLMTNQSPFACPTPMSCSIDAAAVSGPKAPAAAAAAAAAATGSTARCGSACVPTATPVASAITSFDRMQQQQQQLSGNMSAPLPAHIAAECWRQQQQQSMHSCMSEPAQLPWRHNSSQQQNLLGVKPMSSLAAEKWGVAAAMDDVVAAAVAAAAAAAAKNAHLEGKLAEVQEQMKQMQQMIMALKGQQQQHHVAGALSYAVLPGAVQDLNLGKQAKDRVCIP